MNFTSLAKSLCGTLPCFLAALALSSQASAAQQDFYITDASLACTSGAGGSQVFCNIVEVHVNEVIEVGFNLPVDPASLNASSFQVINVDSGTSPSGSLRVSPLDPTRILFEPDLVAPGSLNFTFEPNRTYELLINGTAQGDAGPFIRSTTGDANQGRFLAAVITNQGLLPFVRSECVTTPNSVGAGALMSASGDTSIFFNDLVLETSGLPAGTFGVYIVGRDAAFSPLGSGSLCVGGMLRRLAGTQSSASGTASLPLDLPLIGGGISVRTGESWRFQHVYRDAGPTGATFTTSDAIRVTFTF
jgi:hypothetical protein